MVYSTINCVCGICRDRLLHLFWQERRGRTSSTDAMAAIETNKINSR